MQTWNTGRFLQHALPLELESLRLIGLDRITTSDAYVWRSYLIPIDAPRWAPPWEFEVDMLWQLECDPPTLQFWTVARIALPANTRPWLKREICIRNEKSKVALFIIEHGDGTLSLSAAVVAEVAAGDVEHFMAKQPERPIIEGFAQVYEKASEMLLVAWQDGMKIGNNYRNMN